MTPDQFDTSGNVQRVILSNRPGGNVFADGTWRWSDLSPFEQGYVEALFVELTAELHGNGAHHNPRFSDLHPEALAAVLADCAASGLKWRRGRVGGRDFWEIRQRGRYIDFPPLTPTLADDGKVHLSTIERAEAGR